MLSSGVGLATTLPEGTHSEVNNTTSHPQIEDGLLASDQTATSLTHVSDDNITVIIEAAPDRMAAVERILAGNGTIETQYDTQLQASIARERVPAIAEHEAVEFIRRPITPQQGAVTSEGIGTIRADAAHNRAESGDNATIAIIDSGFTPGYDPIAENIVATRDYTGRGLGGGDTTHGDATAEIVVDTAPDANIILVSVATSVEFAKAAEWINNQGDIDVATASLGFYGLPNDGTSAIDTAINPGPQTDTAWFVSTGNEANGSHWRGEWRDTGGTDDALTFEGSGSTAVETNCFQSREQFTAILQWDDWGSPSERYALGLYRYDEDQREAELLEISDNQQNAGAPPVERISWVPQTGEIFCVAIVNNGADGTAVFDLFLRTDNPATKLDYTSADGSVLVPATNRYGIGVGAIHWADETLEPYSSRGPTVDGRLKPEIVGPTGVSTVAYGTESYFGTSAAAPHIAGAAAVVHSANTSAVGTDLQDRLLQTARSPAGVTRTQPVDNTVGYGVGNVQRALPPEQPTSITVPDSIDATNTSRTNVTVSVAQSSYNRTATVVVEDQAGERKTAKTPVMPLNTTVTVGIDVAGLQPGNLTVRAKLSDEFGWSNPTGLTAPTTTNLTTNNTKHASGVSQALFDAIDSDNNAELSRGELRNAVEQFVRAGEIDGLSIDRTAIRNLVKFFVRT
jgi:hypothetical protein